MNCSKSTVSYHCSKLVNNEEKIKDNVNIKNTKQKIDKSFLMEDVDIDIVISLRKQKFSYKEINEKTKISINSIKKICREFKLIDKKRSSRIDVNEIEKIKNLYSLHKSLRKVSLITGYNRSTVRKYVEIDPITKKVTKSQAVINWRRRAKIKLVEYKGGECEKCGYDKCIDALEFHHNDPSEKDFTISGKSWSFDRLRDEVDKCIMVCSNCHKEIHYELKNKK